MTDIVIVPTFDRPEYLWLCLENIFKAKGSNEKWVWICEDIHADKPKGFTVEMEMLATIRYFQNMTEQYCWPIIKYVGRSPHTTYGNSYNVLASLQEAASHNVECVYLVEDDVLITEDFFQWNKMAHEAFRPWVTCAGRLNRSLNFAMNGPEAIDESIQDVNLCHASLGAYNSWATCFSREALSAIVSMTPAYEFFRAGFEQDIMIQNHIRRHKLVSVWPYVPRAYHMGWYSYHRDGMRPYGTLEEKVKSLRSAISNPAKIRDMASIQQIDAFPKKKHELAAKLMLKGVAL